MATASAAALSQKSNVEEAAQRLIESLEEIERRKASAQSLPKTALAQAPFAIPANVANQKVFLMNLSSVQQRPSSDQPGIRVLGAFETKQDLEEHVEDCYAGHDCALHMAYQGQSFVICRSLEDQQNAEYVNKKCQEVLAWHAQKTQEEQADFKQHYDAKTPGAVGKSIKAQREKAKKHTKTSTRQLAYKTTVARKLELQQGKRVKPIPRNAELRDQSVVVIDVFIDPDRRAWKGKLTPEPVVTIWGIFPDDQKANSFMEYYGGSPNVRDRHLYSIPAYDWNQPETKDDFDIPEKARNPEEDKILQRMRAERTHIDKFTQDCAQLGTKVPEENEAPRPDNPHIRAKMFNDKGEELPVVKGPQPTSEPKAFPVLPKKRDFFELPHARKDGDVMPKQ